MGMYKQKHFRPKDLKENPSKYTISILDMFLNRNVHVGTCHTLNKG